MRVLFLDLDTLRPDHLGCYGYHRDTSPNIDRIAAEGVRFDNYYTSDAPCLPSRAALVSGMFGIHNGAVGHGGTCADMRVQGESRDFFDAISQNSLWNVFRKAGMQTCSISPFAQRHTAWWFLAGFNEMHNHVHCGGNESAEQITPTVLKWLDDHAAQDNWFLHVNYWDAHTPYRAPEEFGNPFADSPLPAQFTPELVEKHGKLSGPHTARDNGMYSGNDSPQFPRNPNDLCDMTQMRRCIDGYDCGIRYMDGHIGQLLNKLEESGVLADTVIIVTSDHGENFGELGIYSEHGTADAITCRIPMIIRWPGVTRPGVDKEFHYNLDLAPTAAEMLQVQPAPHWDGQSFAATLKEGKSAGREGLILSQMAHVCQRSVRWDRWLYIRTYHDGLHPHFAPEMLFDLQNDPLESEDVSAGNPLVVQEAKARLQEWFDRMMATQPFGWQGDPLQTVLAEGGPKHSKPGLKIMKDYFNRLRETGRADGVAAILQRHPELTSAS